MSVHKKLMAARLELQGRKLNKSGHNKFAGYKYFELGDFLPSIQEIFAQQGLCGVVSFFPDVAVLTITDMDDGTYIHINSPMSSAALKGCHEVQNLGAVQTYLRRYLWVTAMEIVEHDALDATTGAETNNAKQPFKPATKADIKPVVKTVNGIPVDENLKYITPVPKAKVHTVMEGKVGDWQLKVTEDADGNWGDAVKAATDVCLTFAKTTEDVQNIFKNNRVIYDKLKEENKPTYDDIMTQFKATKESLTKE
jgi:hypothetical protein